MIIYCPYRVLVTFRTLNLQQAARCLIQPKPRTDAMGRPVSFDTINKVGNVDLYQRPSDITLLQLTIKAMSWIDQVKALMRYISVLNVSRTAVDIMDWSYELYQLTPSCIISHSIFCTFGETLLSYLKGAIRTDREDWCISAVMWLNSWIQIMDYFSIALNWL